MLKTIDGVNVQTYVVEVMKNLSKLATVFQLPHFEGSRQYIGYHNVRLGSEARRLARETLDVGTSFRYCVLIILTSTPERRYLRHREQSELIRASLLQRILPRSLFEPKPL